MEIKEGKIFIVGCGPGSPDYLTAAARRIIEEAGVILGARRLLDLFPGLKSKRIIMEKDTKAILREIAAHRERRVAVLVTGDPGLYSLASLVIRRFGRGACEVMPGISSVQTAFARLGLPWHDAKIISAHAAAPGFDGEELSACGKIAVLAGDDGLPERLETVARFMIEKGYRIFLCEDLTLPEERIRETDAADLKTNRLSRRAVILIVRKDLL